MTLDTSLQKEFTTQESYDYDNLIDEAIETVLGAQTFLGPERRNKQQDEIAAIVAQLERTKKAQVALAEELPCKKMGLEDFKARGLEPSREVEKYMQTHNFYLLRLPVTLMPASGWIFTRLECWLGMDGGSGEPKVHDIYPERAWIDILKVRSGLNVGLNEELKFHAALGAGDIAYQNLSAGAQARVNVEAQGTAHIVVGPFQYTVSRSQVYTSGVENSQAFWRLDGHEQVEREEPTLAWVVRVPRATRKLVTAAKVTAYRRFDLLGADLKDWKNKFGEKLQSFFSVGIPKTVSKNWTNHLD